MCLPCKFHLSISNINLINFNHCRDGSIYLLCAESSRVLHKRSGCHNGDVQDIDCVNGVLVSGSRDQTAKVRFCLLVLAAPC